MNYTGNVDYKSIHDKQYLTADSENVSEIVKKLNEQGIEFSARYDNTKMTITFHKGDFDKVNSILNSAAGQQEKSQKHAQIQDNVVEYVGESMTSPEELEKVSNKTIKNIQENEQFIKTFADYQEHKLAPSVILNLGTTPYSLQLAGAKDLPLNITQTTIENAMNPENVRMHGHTSGHDISPHIVEKLPELLRTPIMVLRDKASNNLTAILDQKDKQGRNIICRIVLDKNQAQYTVNRISSMYGKRELANFINQAYDEKRVVAVHKEKAEQLLHSIGCQSSKENTTISFDDSIAYTIANVKYPNQEEKLTVQFNELSMQDNTDNKTFAQLEELRKMLFELQQEQQRLNQQTDEEKTEEPRQNADTANEHPTAVNDNPQLGIREIKPEHSALVPIISTKVVKHEQRIEELKERREIQENKISNLQSKAEKLTAKADRLTATNQMLAELMARNKMPTAVVNSVRALIRANESKAADIRNEKLPKLESKIGKRMKKIESIDKRINLRQCKINRYTSLNNVITSFTHGDRKQFSASLDELHNNTINMLNAKIDVKTDNIVKMTTFYKQSPVKAAAANVPLRLSAQKRSRQKLIQKRNKLMGVIIPYASQPEQVQENIMKQAEEIITNAAKQENIAPAQTAENVVLSAVPLLPEQSIEVPDTHREETDRLLPEIAVIMEMPVSQLESKPRDLRDILVLDYTNNFESTPEEIQESLARLMNPDVRTEEKIEKRQEQTEAEKTEGAVSAESTKNSKKDNPLKTTEELAEGNANMIDGIINNEPPKEDEPKEETQKEEKPQQTFSVSLAQLKRNAKRISQQKSGQPKDERKPPDHGTI